MWIIRWMFITLIILLVLGFSLQNTQVIEVQFMGWQSGLIPIFFVVYFAFGAGMVVFLLIAAYYQVQQKIEIGKCKRKIDRLNEELDRLRTASLDEGYEDALSSEDYSSSEDET